MGGVEHLRVLGANRDEIAHVEKAPVIDALSGDLPIRELIWLLIEELVEKIEARRIVAASIVQPNVLIQKFANRRKRGVDFPQLRFHLVAFTPPRFYLFPIGDGPGR